MLHETITILLFRVIHSLFINYSFPYFYNYFMIYINIASRPAAVGLKNLTQTHYIGDIFTDDFRVISYNKYFLQPCIYNCTHL